MQIPEKYSLLFYMAAALTAGALLSCSTTHYNRAADKEVYRIIDEKSGAVPGMPDAFSLGEPEKPAPAPEGWYVDMLSDLPRLEEGDPAFSEGGFSDTGAAVIPLEHALKTAVNHNRNYQNRKEAVYLEALALTLDRHDYTPVFGGLLSGRYHRSTRDLETASTFSEATSLVRGNIQEIADVTGAPADILSGFAAIVEESGELAGLDQTRTLIEDRRSVSGGTSFNVNMLMKGGGRMAVDLTSNFLRYLTGDPETATSSSLSATFTQPLLRGAGRLVAAEKLTQAERDMLYTLRDFTRFRKVFVIDICDAYFGVLETRDSVKNNWRSLENFRASVERERAFAAEGLRTQADLGRLEQALLNNENTWINSVRRYQAQLDDFKIRLGIPTDANIVLDDGELARLRASGLKHPDIVQEDAVKVALATRLDYWTERDRIEDAERKAKIAARNLWPDLDIVAGADIDSTGQDNFQELDFKRARWSAGLDLGLPFDRKAERNAARAALISWEKALREFSLAEDSIRLEVRTAWRDLQQAKRNYEIAETSVRLNRRRVEEQKLLAELGRSTALDQVDAQNDLTAALNDLTSAMIRHNLARLRFWRDMGILYIRKDGQWEEITDDKAN
jgi:outer membrane protein TolC